MAKIYIIDQDVPIDHVVWQQIYTLYLSIFIGSKRFVTPSFSGALYGGCSVIGGESKARRRGVDDETTPDERNRGILSINYSGVLCF